MIFLGHGTVDQVFAGGFDEHFDSACVAEFRKFA